jgi:hypothetical protein
MYTDSSTIEESIKAWLIFQPPTEGIISVTAERVAITMRPMIAFLFCLSLLLEISRIKLLSMVLSCPLHISLYHLCVHWRGVLVEFILNGPHVALAQAASLSYLRPFLVHNLGIIIEENVFYIRKCIYHSKEKHYKSQRTDSTFVNSVERNLTGRKPWQFT